MNRIPLLAIALAIPLSACGGGGGPAAVTVDPAAFVAGIDHKYFPISKGRTWDYVGEDSGLGKRESVTTLDATRMILGVACTAVHGEVFLDGVLTEVSTEWFAEDARGNVWKFGEEALDWDGVNLARTEDSWIAGVGGARPWVAFLANPRVGDRVHGYVPGGEEVLVVRAVDQTVVLPSGVFTGCIEIVENPDDPEDSDIILYAPGVGKVSETNPTGRVELGSTTGG